MCNSPWLHGGSCILPRSKIFFSFWNKCHALIVKLLESAFKFKCIEMGRISGSSLLYSDQLSWFQTAAEDDWAVGAIPKLSDGGVPIHRYAWRPIASTCDRQQLFERRTHVCVGLRNAAKYSCDKCRSRRTQNLILTHGVRDLPPYSGENER